MLSATPASTMGPFSLTRRGRRVAAMIDTDDLKRLTQAAEDLADIEAARAARAEVAEHGTIPLGRGQGGPRTRMTHRIELSPAAARQLRKLDARARRRVQAVVELLAQDPCPAGAKEFVGGAWRVARVHWRLPRHLRDRWRCVVLASGGTLLNGVTMHLPYCVTSHTSKYDFDHMSVCG